MAFTTRIGRCTAGSAGFTLIELTLVVFLIAIIMAVALPQFLPAIAFTNLEGAARHLAGWGRATMAHCAVKNETFTVRIDLDNQEYWAVRWVMVDEGLFEEDGDAAGVSGERNVYDQLQRTTDPQMRMAQDADRIRQQFDRYMKMSVEARSRNVKREGILDEIGPLFEKEFTLDDEEDDKEEVKEDLIARVRLPESVRFALVRVGDEEYTAGMAEVEMTPMGLAQEVVVELESEDGEYYTITWDSITGGARLQPGREEREFL